MNKAKRATKRPTNREPLLRPRTPKTVLAELATQQLRIPRTEGTREVRKEYLKMLEDFRDACKRAEAVRMLSQVALEQFDEAASEQQLLLETGANEEAAKKEEATEAALRQILELQVSMGIAVRDISEIYAQSKQATWERTTTDGKKESGIASALEIVHREFVRQRVNFVEFKMAFEQLALIEKALVHAAPATAGFVPTTQKEIERVAIASHFEVDSDAIDEQIPTMIPEPGAETDPGVHRRSILPDLMRTFDAATAQKVMGLLQQSRAKKEADDSQKPKTKIGVTPREQRRRTLQELRRMSLHQLQSMREKVHAECEEFWEKPEIRNAWIEQQLAGLVAALIRGDDVLALSSTTRALNTLAQWEAEDPRCIVGGVLVGEPGVGKSTTIEDYLRLKGRKEPVRMDMSEDLTRYSLFGSVDIHAESELDRFKHLTESVAQLKDEEVLDLVRHQSDRLKETMKALSDEERTVVAFAQLQERVAELSESGEESLNPQAALLREKLRGIASKAYLSELAKRLADITNKNGWRDGTIIHALRTDRSLIVDEFNKARSWTLINKLLTSKTGEVYEFTDNNEKIPIPSDWRIYFTANIGKKYMRFPISEDLASRFRSRVMEMTSPPAIEEWFLTLATLTDASLQVVRDRTDMYKMQVLVFEAFKQIREAIRSSGASSVPISFRVIREIATKLTTRAHGAVQPRPEMSVDKAVMQSVLSPYVQWEDRSLPRTIAQLLINNNILLDDESIEAEVCKWSGYSKEEIQQRRERYHAAMAGNSAEEEFQKRMVETKSSMTALLPLTLTV